jgi:hypothetical protein
MIAQLFAAAITSFSALQPPHWLILAGGALVVLGTIGVLLSGRLQGDAPPEISRRRQPDPAPLPGAWWMPGPRYSPEGATI